MYSKKLLLSLSVAGSLVACNNSANTGAGADVPVDEDGVAIVEETPSDLRLFELKGNVKEVEKETFYDVKLVDDQPQIQSATEGKHRITQMAFDKMGNYITSEYEVVKRDDKGRITYWRDKRPTAKGVDPGFLRDTLSYEHVSHNLVKTSGMGEFSITVYDEDGKIVGQYSDPRLSNTQTSAFNVYRKFDDKGNWTERMTVWTSQSPGGRPHVSYSVDRRKIKYY